MIHANLGDQTVTPRYDSGKTITFNANGGSIEGKESVIYELHMDSENFLILQITFRSRRGISLSDGV